MTFAADEESDFDKQISKQRASFFCKYKRKLFTKYLYILLIKFLYTFVKLKA